MILNKKINSEQAWSKLMQLMDETEISPLDLMAVVCTKFVQCGATEEKTKIMVAGEYIEITLKKV